MIPEDRVISFKTDAWKDPNMVAGYLQNINSIDGGNIVKNRVEVELIGNAVRGETVLDVGVGTGRASVPLAKRGMRVTGVDSSAAMLDATRANAGTTPIELQIGDVAKLQFADRSFDNVIGLNTLAHFPHWQAIVGEWTRLVRDGGRIIFDAYSLDHVKAYARGAGLDPGKARELFPPAGAEDYMLRLGADELIGEFDKLGFTVTDITPYGVLFGSSARNRFFNRWALGFAWDRMLSYIAVDKDFLEFCLFVEQEIIAPLTPSVSHRYMVVAERRKDPATNAAWLTRMKQIDDVLANGRLAGLKPFGIDIDRWKARLNPLLENEPSRMALVRLLSSAERWPGREDVLALLPAHWSQEVRELLSHLELDMAVSEAFKELRNDPEAAKVLDFSGTSLAPILDYSLTRRILEEGFGAFEEGAK